jgi:hypothetical protein
MHLGRKTGSRPVALSDARRKAFVLLWVAGLALSIFATQARSQELEVRRWSHLPIGSNVGGTGYGYTNGDVAFDPVLQLGDVEVEMHSYPIKYLRSFELLGKSARFEVWQIYQDAFWQGTLSGQPASTDRSGWSDMSMRLAVNLIGAPPLKGEEFAEYRSKIPDENIVGFGMVVQIPTGHYIDDRLLNLGSNRYTFRPQVGWMHNRENWSIETTGSAWLYTDNDRFFDGNLLEQLPFYTLESHIDYSFRPGLWAGAGLGYGIGGASSINGIDRNDTRENLGFEASVAYPIKKELGVRIGYVGLRRLVPFGVDSDSFLASLSLVW